MFKKTISCFLVLIMVFSYFINPLLVSGLLDNTSEQTNIENQMFEESQSPSSFNNNITPDAQQIENTKNAENIESIENVNNIENIENIDNIQNNENIDKIENVDKIQNTENIENVDNTEKEKNSNELNVDNSKDFENLPKIEGIKDVEKLKDTKDLETTKQELIKKEDINDFNISINENVKALIVENSKTVLKDFGIENGFIADIELISRPFSLRNSTVVTLKTPQYCDKDNLSVVHFIEDPYYISEDTIILNVSNYSTKTKNVLTPAINAYQEYSNTTDEFVAIEIFEDILIEDDTITFETESFSIFAVGTVFLNTFEFYVEGELINTQYIIGDSSGKGLLEEPDMPEKERHQFKGWKINDTNKYQSFGNISVNMSEHTTIKLYADFEEVCYAYFLYEAREGSYVLETIVGCPGDTVSTLNIDYPLNLDKHVLSWHTDVSLNSPSIESITFVSGEDVILYPNVIEGYWVTFYTDGGSYLEPIFYEIGQTLIEPEDPYKEGYSFIGWFDENGNEFTFNGQAVTESIKLTAYYEAENVNYTVQIVMQNPNKPDKYDPVLGGIFTLTGLCGDTVKATDIPISQIESVIADLANTNYFKSNLKYFYYSDSSNATESITLKSNGSSVLYIYYDRYMTELNYYLNYSDTEPWKVQSGLFDADAPSSYWLTPTEDEYPNFGKWESEPGLFPVWTGRFDYGFKFDEERNVFYHNVYATKGEENAFHFYTYVQAINPDGTVPDVGVDITNTPYRPHLDYYNPNYPGNEGNQALIDNWSNIDFATASKDELTNNNTWLLYEAQDLPFVANMTYLTMFYDAEWYNGFTAVAVGFDLYHKVANKLEAWPVDDYSTNRDWQSYVTYLNSGRVEVGAIEGSANKITNDKNFYYLESDKWYAIDTPFKIVKFYGNGYMRLIRNQFNLQFVMEDKNVAEYDVYFETDLGLDKFTSVSDKLTPPEGYVFDGWFTSPTLTEDTRFNLETNTMPSTDLILYGKWKAINVELSVHVTIEGTDTIIEGFNGFTVKYGEKVDKDRVDKLIDSVNVPEGAIWYGWYEKINVGKNSTVLVPYNFNRELITDLVLYPFYSYVEPTNIKYELNGGSGSAPIDEYSYAVGKGAVILRADKVIPPENKFFNGWNTKPDGTGETYLPNDVMLLTEKNSTLYALYTDIPTEDNMVVSLTYYNTISGEEIIETHKIYDTITVKNPSIFTEEISKRYIFKEFNTSADGSGTSFYAGDGINATFEGENILYAIYDVVDDIFLDIPITKRFENFYSENEIFTIKGFFCDENGEQIDETIENVSFVYEGAESISKNLEIQLDIDALNENEIYYIKVYESSQGTSTLYDTNYYIVSFTINGLTPTILDAKKYMEDGTEISSFVYENSLDFTTKVVIFSVTVPIALPIDVDSNGVVTTIPVVIINNSTDTVVVKNMTISSVDNWEIVNWDSADMVAEKVGAKKIAISINGDKTTDDGLITFTASNFPKIDSPNNSNNNELLITYDAKLPAQLTSISNLTVANVVFTVGFNKEEINNT